MTLPIPEKSLSELSQAVTRHMGLHFPRDRWADLLRALDKASAAMGFPDTASLVLWLLDPHVQEARVLSLVRHLTIGETHFFRDEKLFQELAERILPDLIAGRRSNGRNLRIWSAGCATGEEPYSVAIALSNVLYDLADWRVTILGSDINREFLKKAAEGVYTQWSFRSVPPGIQERFFKQKGDQYCIRQDVKRLVKFCALNLVKDSYPNPENDTHNMDVIFCRNVLMYFTPERQQQVLDNLCESLVDGGWLVVSAAEASIVQNPGLVQAHCPGVVLFRKVDRESAASKAPMFTFPMPAFELPSDYLLQLDPPVSSTFVMGAAEDFALSGFDASLVAQVVDLPEDEPVEAGRELFLQARYAEAVDKLLEELSRKRLSGIEDPDAMALLARANANQGRLDEALECAEKAIALDKLNSDYHYLRGSILQEKGEIEEATSALTRAVFLNPDLVSAHFALANLALRRGKPKDSDRHFRIALSILSEYGDEDAVTCSEGMTAGKLTEIIQAMMRKERPR